MHVLLANNVYPPIQAGGAELMVAWLAEGLAAQGHRVTVVSTCGPEMEPYPVEVRNGVEVIRFFPRNVYWSFARGRQPAYRRAVWHLRDAWNRDAGRRFRTILAAGNPDLVHTHLIDGFSATIWARARQAGVPIVHTAHDYHLLCPRAFLMTRDWKPCTHPGLACRAYRAWHLATARDVDLFVSPSQFLLERHLGAGFSPRRSAIIRNGIRLFGDALRNRYQRSPTGRIRFLFLGRLTVEKGVRIILNAVSRLPPTLDFELLIAGRGPLEQEVRTAMATDRRICFMGFVTGDAKDALLATAHHLLVPSLWYENAPVVLVEAAACGLGVIASRIGGIPELVREGRTGVLIAPGDAAELAAAMSGLAAGSLKFPDLPTDTAAIAEEHSVDRMVADYLAHYARVMSAGNCAQAARQAPASVPASLEA